MSHDNAGGAIDDIDMRRTLSESLGVVLDESPYKFQREPSSSVGMPSAIDTEAKSDGDYWYKTPAK